MGANELGRRRQFFRENLRSTKKEYAKTEVDLKSLQSVGQLEKFSGLLTMNAIFILSSIMEVIRGQKTVTQFSFHSQVTQKMAQSLLLGQRPYMLQRLQAKIFGEVDKEVERKQRELSLWIYKLEVLDVGEHKDITLEKDIRDLVCRLENVLQTFFDKIQSRRSVRTKNNFRKLIRFFEVEERSDKIVSTIRQLKRTAATNTEEEERSLSENKNQGNLSYQNTNQGKENFVGMEDEFNSLFKDHILSPDKSLKFVCIYGMNGTGKTALARKIYNMNDDTDHFDCCAWIDLSQNSIRETIIRNMLKQLSGGKETTKWSDLESLRQGLYKALKDQRYFVVFDDMSSLETWDSLRRLFPNDRNGSRLMVTTRLREVATYVAGDDRDGFILMKRNLNKSEASKLFRKTVLLGDHDNAKPLLEQYEKKILSQCRGLPSTIIAVGQLLAKKHAFEEWEKVPRTIKSLVDRGLQVDQFALEQSISALRFDNLPYPLKPCFLYLGLFPKELMIEVEHLYLLWMVEGIISPADCQNNETIMDLAERYLSDLVERKMIEVEEEEEETPSSRKFKSCRVYEDMLDHCLQQGGEYFFKVLGPSTQAGADSSSSVRYPMRRMAVHLSKQDDSCTVDHHFSNDLVNHLKSLLFLNPHDLLIKWEWPRKISLRKFRTLRVLKFEHIDFQDKGLPSGLTKLIFLRYLSFNRCIFKALPSSIANLSLLEILDLRASNQIIIPNVLRKMEKLRYLYLPLTFETPNGKLCLRSLKELELLENFDTRVCDATDLFEMTNLRHLSITVEGMPGDLEQIISRLDMTSEETSVFNAFIKVKNFDCYMEERHSVFGKLLNCQVLHTLHMYGHLGQLPPHKITSSLTEIVLIGSQLKDDPMTTLNKLRELRVLVLKDNAFIGKEMTCFASYFKQLKRLELLNLHFLETLDVQNRAMLKLSKLTIKGCGCLKQQTIPDGIKGRVPPVTFENDISCCRL